MVRLGTLATRTTQRNSEVVELESGRVLKVTRISFGEERADSMVELASPATKPQDSASTAVLRLVESPNAGQQRRRRWFWMACAA